MTVSAEATVRNTESFLEKSLGPTSDLNPKSMASEGLGFRSCTTEILALYRDNGKENGNYYITYWGCIGIPERSSFGP